MRCGAGAVWDVAVDVRPGSPTYAQHVALELSRDNGLQLLIPTGFLHGFVTLTDNAELIYKCTDTYSPAHDGALAWDDPAFAIPWPQVGPPILSDKDRAAPRLGRVDQSFLSHFIVAQVSQGHGTASPPFHQTTGLQENQTMTTRKGIILAGGTGTRLYPITIGISKQLLPIYDKPMIYYPLSVLMLAGIRDIAVITTPQDQDQFRRTLGDGSQWGLRLTYIAQPRPEGLAQAYLLAETFLNGAPSAMVLGDNIFFGHGLPDLMAQADRLPQGGTVFGYHVADPQRYGVVDFAPDGSARAIVEKPPVPPSNYAVTGLYFLDGTAPARAAGVVPSARGELEITTLLETYLHEGLLTVQKMGRGYAWLDTGTHASLLDAGNFVRTLEERQGLQTGSPDEIAWQQGWIDGTALAQRAHLFGKTAYGAYLAALLESS